MSEPVKNLPGTWEPPPPVPVMSMMSTGFGFLALIAAWFGYCDIAAALAAVAFVFGIGDMMEISQWGIMSVRRGSGPDRPPSLPLAAGATGFELSASFAVLMDRCNFARIALIIAVLLGIVSIVRRRKGAQAERPQTDVRS